MDKNLFQNKRLNDYDLNILNENSFKELDDTSLKLEYEIAEKEEALDALNNKIKGAELLGKLLDVMELKIKAKTIENELVELKNEYAKRNLSERLSPKVIKSKKRMTPLKVFARFMTRKVFSKISKKFKSIADLSDSLDTLSSINDNVDELIAMKIPYGETKSNYEKLTNYLYRANKIHSQINKELQKK